MIAYGNFRDCKNMTGHSYFISQKTIGETMECPRRAIFYLYDYRRWHFFIENSTMNWELYTIYILLRKHWFILIVLREVEETHFFLKKKGAIFLVLFSPTFSIDFFKYPIGCSERNLSKTKNKNDDSKVQFRFIVTRIKNNKKIFEKKKSIQLTQSLFYR